MTLKKRGGWGGVPPPPTTDTLQYSADMVYTDIDTIPKALPCWHSTSFFCKELSRQVAVCTRQENL